MTNKYETMIFFRITNEHNRKLRAHLAQTGLTLGSFFRRKISELRPSPSLMGLSANSDKQTK